MAGTKAGSEKAMTTIYSEHGFTETGHSRFHSQIGSEGGKKGKADGTIKGFALMSKDKVALACKVGGTISRKDRKLSPKERSDVYKRFRELSEMSKNSIISRHRVTRPW